MYYKVNDIGAEGQVHDMALYLEGRLVMRNELSC